VSIVGNIINSKASAWWMRPILVAFMCLLCRSMEASELILPQVLTSVDQIRHLPLEEAARAHEVRIKGVITYRAQGRSLLFIQDDTGGIYVNPNYLPQDLRMLGVGTRLDLEGSTGAGRFAPFVEGRGGRTQGVASLPPPRWLSPDQLGDPRNHSQWVELSGLVRSVHRNLPEEPSQRETILNIGASSGRFMAVIYGAEASSPSLTNLTGALVRARGVYGSIFNERRQLIGMRLFVNSDRDIIVDKPDGSDPFATPPRPIVSLMQFESIADTPSRTHVHGRVTLVVDDGFYLEDEAAGTRVTTVSPPAIKSGDFVDAVGFSAWGDWNPVLEDAEVRSAQVAGPAFNIPLLTPVQALTGNYCFRLVRMEALVVQTPNRSHGSPLILQSGDMVFQARFVRETDTPTIKVGSWIRLDGICINQNRTRIESNIASPDANQIHRASVFHLLLGSPSDLVVLRPASWWTVTRLLTILAILCVSLLASALWVFLLRRQISAKTEIIRQQMARKTVLEERERIARELHDSMEQEMTGISMQLDAADAMLDQKPETSRTAIKTARALLDHSRIEARRSIWDLRSPDLEQGGLPLALDEIVRQSQGTSDIPVVLTVTGQVRRLPASIESHLLRIAHEALTNAIKHSNGTRVVLECDFQPDQITLNIWDNGRGFNPGDATTAQQGHFGLLGMKERAGKIHGRLTIQSQPGQGSTITITVNYPPSPSP
jgi:signal transduction histidine kinase